MPKPAETAVPQAAPARAPWWRRLRPSRSPLRLNLALQGGGAHGAFTWGVLDALLGDDAGDGERGIDTLTFEGISGSSAGAMNAVVLAHGWMSGGRAGARAALATFWTAIGKQMSPVMVRRGRGEDDIDLSPASKLMASLTDYFSPWQLNPLDVNPLRDLLLEQIDFERLRAASPFRLFIGATHAHSGKLRVFREHELSVDVLLASACLPKLQRSVEIDGQPYWDGGYSANPAVFPLFYDCESRDILLVLLSPLVHEGMPKTAEEINARILELGFSAHFMREMRMFARATAVSRPSLLALGGLDRRLRQVRFHMIDTSDVTSLRRSATKLLAYGPFLAQLHRQGRERGQAWLQRHVQDIGRCSTIDVQRHFG